MKRVQVDYLADDTMTQDVDYGKRARYKVHPDGRGHVRLDGQLTVYAQVVRIRVTDVDEPGDQADMS